MLHVQYYTPVYIFPPYICTRPEPPRSTLFNLLAVLICVLVLCPRTGRPIACLRPLYVPISFNLRMLSCTSRRASFSIFIVDNSAVRSMTVAFLSAPTLAQGWMWNLAMMFCETLGPMPKKLSRDRYWSVRFAMRSMRRRTLGHIL
jgi:hypothetical protein